MLSSKGRDAEVEKGLAMGADLYGTKPFSTRELMASIVKLLEHDADLVQHQWLVVVAVQQGVCG